MARLFSPPVLLVVAAFVIAGCSSEPSQPQFSDVDGVYRLQVSQGTVMSARLDPSTTVNVTGGVLDLQAVWHFNLRYTTETGYYSVSGSYRKSDGGVTLHYHSGMSQAASISGTTLTVNSENGQVLVFQKVE